MVNSSKVSLMRRMMWRLLQLLLAVFALALVLVGVWFSPAVYDHFVTFPRHEAAWHKLSAARVATPAIQNRWKEFRGILHSHSKLSHDSEVEFEQIVAAMKTAHLDFICLSDHCTAGRADFDAQWRGFHEGKLFVPGFEMKDGIMPFGVSSGIVLSNQTDSALLARQVDENGGVLFYAHPEEPRQWDCPQLTGMEIYNIHTDFKRLKGGLRKLLPQLFVNQRRYPMQVFYSIFQRPTEFIRRWDDLNKGRHITGIAGNDCHQNTGARMVCISESELRLEDTSPKTLRTIKLNWLTRTLAKICFGELRPGRKLAGFQLDPYERMASFVNTHLLATDLTEQSVLGALRSGRVFVAFDSIVDSSGFMWAATVADDPGQSAVMGERLPYHKGIILRAASPVPCRFSVFSNGEVLTRHTGTTLEVKPPGPGKYRVEAELEVSGEWVPWVYANPLELTAENPIAFQ